MADRNRVSGPYQAMAEDIENRKKAESVQRSPMAREPIARRFTPLSPEGPVGRVPVVGPAAGPAASMGAALSATGRISPSSTKTSTLVDDEAPPGGWSKATIAAREEEKAYANRYAGGAPRTATATALPQGRAMTDVNPYAAPDRAMSDVNPAVAAAPVARYTMPAPQRAVSDVNAAIEAQPAMPVGRDVYGNVQWTPAMTSPAALRLQQRMNATNEARSLGFQPGSARAMQLQSQWDEAARAAFTGAMTPQQQAAYEREQAAERMRQGAAFRETPQYQMGEQALRRDVGVAGEQARGLIGASATKAEQERLNREAELKRTERTESGADARARLLNEREMEQTRMTTKTQKEVAQGKEPTDADRLDKFLNEAVGNGAVAADLPALADEWRKIHGVSQQGSEGAQSNAQRIAMLQERLAQYPNDPKAPAAREELKRLQALK